LKYILVYNSACKRYFNLLITNQIFMSKNLTTNGFAQLDPMGLIAKGRHIATQLSLNVAVFATPVPAVAIISNAVEELEAAESAAETGDRNKIAARDDKFAALVDILQQGGTYVNTVANGDRTIALLSGYDVRKPNEPRVMQPITAAPKAKRMPAPGSVKSRVESQKAATKGVNWYISSDASKPMSEWTKMENERSTILFEGLVPGVEYYICAELLGPRRQSEMSPRATVIA
jgi:hypothetical protein